MDAALYDAVAATVPAGLTPIKTAAGDAGGGRR